MNDDQALRLLDSALARLPGLLEDSTHWDSLVINRRKPWTFRVSMYLDEGLRVSLHRFAACDEHESSLHPHPWPGAFAILRGRYLMNVGRSDNRTDRPKGVAKFLMNEGSRYAITDPLTWHSVAPLVECYTVMVNGVPWPEDLRHVQVRTTQGKGLAQMTEQQLEDHFAVFRECLGRPRIACA
jgi:hypothetical protein